MKHIMAHMLTHILTVTLILFEIKNGLIFKIILHLHTNKASKPIRASKYVNQISV